MKDEKHKEESLLPPVRVGISIGDVNGIGPEVVIKALADSRMLMDCTPVIYGSAKTIAFHRKNLGEIDFNYQRINTAEEATPRKVNIVSCWSEEVQYQMGTMNETGGKYSYISLERATQDLAAGKVDVLVTAPISKEAISKAGFQFPGHTEYLADQAGMSEALMMMVSGNLRVALVTTHVALKDVSAALSREKILEKIRMVNQSLKKDFGIVRPRIAVFGLNPHAGENGKMGTEEQETINPAINMARAEEILAFGPFPADGFFGSSQLNAYDAVLAMYHDQGLAAFKALAFEDGVNFTAGLPIVRTSPDHGTAFDIAGQDKANPQSFRSAIYTSIDIYRNRQFYKEIHQNPLKPQPQGSGKNNRDSREGVE